MSPLQPPVDAPIHLLAGYAQFYAHGTPEFMLHVPGRALWVAGSRRTDRTYRLASLELTARTAFDYQGARCRRTLLRRPLPAWARYASGMLLRLAAQDLECSGFQIAVVGDEGADARYIYALGAAFGVAYCECAGVTVSEERLMDDLEHVRRTYVRD